MDNSNEMSIEKALTVLMFMSAILYKEKDEEFKNYYDAINVAMDVIEKEIVRQDNIKIK